MRKRTHVIASIAKRGPVIARLTKSAEAISTIVLVALLLVAPVSAQIPQMMQFQGKATDANDVPLNGSYKLTFRIYDAETGGTPIWNETHNAVPIENSVFSVALGSVTPLNIAFDRPYWISTEIGTTNGSGELPRQAITSVGYAYSAEAATRADNSGKVVQVVNTQTGAKSQGSTTIPYDDTIPQRTEGNEVMALAITPTNVNNKLKIEVTVAACSDSAEVITVALFQDAAANALAAVVDRNSNEVATISFTHFMTAGTIAAATFKVRIGSAAGATTFNGRNSGRKYGGVCASSITITEIAQ